MDTVWISASPAIGQLKAKLAKLRKELITPSGGGGGGGSKCILVFFYLEQNLFLSPSVVGFDVARTGVASV